MSYYPERDGYGRTKMKVELDSPKVKKQQAMIHQILLKKDDLAGLKFDIHELNMDKLKNYSDWFKQAKQGNR